MKQSILNEIFWQAHRGGGGFERPDNTLLSLNYGWSMGGIPEVDIRLTADGVLVCLHDNNLNRTTDAPAEIARKEIAQLTFAEISKYDAGIKFAEAYSGEKIPAFYRVLEVLQDNPDRMIYADLKNYDSRLFPALKREFSQLISMYKVAKQVIVCSCDYDLNCQMHKAIPGIHTMQWIGGTVEEQIAIFENLVAVHFNCLGQIQLHLNELEEPRDRWRYTLNTDFLKNSLEICSQAGISMQVFPWLFEKEDLFRLLDIGIRYFTTDEPSKFCNILKEWKEVSCPDIC